MAANQRTELKRGLAVLKEGRAAEAAEILGRVVAATPNDAVAQYGLGRALLSQRKASAEAPLRRAAELNPSNYKAHFALAQLMRLLKRRDDTIVALRDAVSCDPEAVEAVVMLSRLLMKSGQRAEAEGLLRRAVALRPDHNTLCALAELQHFMKHPDAKQTALQAERLEPTAGIATLLGQIAMADNRLDEARAAFERACSLDPQAQEARTALATLQKFSPEDTANPPPVRTRPAIWPHKSSRFNDFEKVVRDFVLTGSRPDQPVILPDSRVSALGSCFAGHIAQRLHDRGLDVFYKQIGEDVNNTYANRYLVDWIVDGLASEHGEEFERIYGAEEREAFHSRFLQTDLFIFTLGVAPAYFHRATGRLTLPHGGDVEAKLLPQICDFRTTSVDENVANLRHILGRLRTLNPAARFVLTVSPVPLAGTYEMPSAVLADALSKSTLRVAVESLLALPECSDAHYWPSFEIVRWLGAHAPKDLPPVFGADDGYSRHVSVWLVDMIMRLFLEYFGGMRPEDSAPAHAPAEIGAGAAA